MGIQFIGRVENQDGQEKVEDQVGIDIAREIDRCFEDRSVGIYAGTVQQADDQPECEQPYRIGQDGAFESVFENGSGHQRDDHEDQRG